MPRMRNVLTAALLVLGLSVSHGAAQERLPDIGSSAGTVLSPAQQTEYGQMLLAQLRHYDMVLEDPLVNDWLRGTGARLASASDQPQQSFTFFVMRDRSVNAFATLGGHIGLNVGLVLAAQTEDEVAAVLAHEVAHVTQNHVLRGAERAQRDSVPILLAMLGAIAVAAGSDSDSSGEAAMAALAGAQGWAIQRQIDYTRSNESEADRLGIRTLARAGYDVSGMASMFERMQAMSRTNQGGDRERLPDYLRTHPVTTTRISEARQRAEQIARESGAIVGTATTPEGRRTERIIAGSPLGNVGTGTRNPLLPASLRLPAGAAAPGGGDPVVFGWTRERMRVLSAETLPRRSASTRRCAATGSWPTTSVTASHWRGCSAATTRWRPRASRNSSRNIPATSGWGSRWPRPRCAPGAWSKATAASTPCSNACPTTAPRC